MKQEITITVDIPEGYEATGEYRMANGEDMCLSESGDNWIAVSGEDSRGNHIILRKKWKPPEFLNPGWIAMDESGAWFWFESEPVFYEHYWAGPGGFARLSEWLNWTPPTVTDWKQSLTRIGGEE